MSDDSDDDVKSDLDDSETLAHVLEELPKATPAVHTRERSMSKSKADGSQPDLQAGSAQTERRKKPPWPHKYLLINAPRSFQMSISP